MICQRKFEKSKTTGMAKAWHNVLGMSDAISLKERAKCVVSISVG
jgi:hypothetical protein